MEKDKVFNIDNRQNLKSDLFHFVQSNLYNDKIIVGSSDEVIVFNWSFSPQGAGTNMQQLAYQNMKITEVVEFILKKVAEKFGN
tara:strand:- start:198 stop:449 length:252 start_codon:yes stop_codon:yes gene_type:complete